MVEPIQVCAAVIRSGDRLLLARRPPGAHMAGQWEFPGGKKLPGESGPDCIRREIAEELGLDVLPGCRLAVLTHRYPEKLVRIEFYDCRTDRPERAAGLDGQEIAWFIADELPVVGMAPVDRRFAEHFLSAEHP